MERTWKPITAGILTIIGGAVGAGFAGCTGCVGAGLVGLSTLLPAIGWPVGLFGTALIAIPITLVVIALVGGSYALARKRWGLALAGAICACFPVIPLGVLSIIFVSLGKKEFA
jgi:hypothetical protein